MSAEDWDHDPTVREWTVECDHEDCDWQRTVSRYVKGANLILIHKITKHGYRVPPTSPRPDFHEGDTE